MHNTRKNPRYQDYVIRDGKLVGEFEEMYRDFDDPWEQSSHEPAALDKTIGLALLQKYGHQRALEYGCGFGHFTAQLQHGLGAAAGVDISQTAIDKARVRFPDATFFVGDINDAAWIRDFAPDALIFAEISWYVLAGLNDFKKLIMKHCEGGGLLAYPYSLPRRAAAVWQRLFYQSRRNSCLLVGCRRYSRVGMGGKGR